MNARELEAAHAMDLSALAATAAAAVDEACEAPMLAMMPGARDALQLVGVFLVKLAREVEALKGGEA